MSTDLDYHDLANCVLGVALQEGYGAPSGAVRFPIVVAERAQGVDVRGQTTYAMVTFTPRTVGDSAWAEAVVHVGSTMRWQQANDPPSARLRQRVPKECRIARRA